MEQRKEQKPVEAPKVPKLGKGKETTEKTQLITGQ